MISWTCYSFWVFKHDWFWGAQSLRFALARNTPLLFSFWAMIFICLWIYTVIQSRHLSDIYCEYRPWTPSKTFKPWCTKSHLYLILSHKIWVLESDSKANSTGYHDWQEKVYAEFTWQQTYATALIKGQEFQEMSLNSLINFLALLFWFEGPATLSFRKCLGACLRPKYNLL